MRLSPGSRPETGSSSSDPSCTSIEAICGMPKVVWMYWEQGWDSAPAVVRECRRSWEHHNPDWEIRCLDGATASEYFDLESWVPGAAGPRWVWSLRRTACNTYGRLRHRRLRLRMVGTRTLSVQGRSNILRIHLLARYGGVWADATLWCHRPLD